MRAGVVEEIALEPRESRLHLYLTWTVSSFGAPSDSKCSKSGMLSSKRQLKMSSFRFGHLRKKVTTGSPHKNQYARTGMNRHWDKPHENSGPFQSNAAVNGQVNSVVHLALDTSVIEGRACQSCANCRKQASHDGRSKAQKLDRSMCACSSNRSCIVGNCPGQSKQLQAWQHCSANKHSLWQQKVVSLPSKKLTAKTAKYQLSSLHAIFSLKLQAAQKSSCWTATLNYPVLLHTQK